MALSFNVMANGNHDNNSHDDHDHSCTTCVGATGPQGPQGVPGVDGVTTIVYDYVYDENALKNLEKEMSAGVAQSGAFAMIPAISHQEKNHEHSSIGIGAATYNDENALAIGLQHQSGAWAYKGGVSLSSGSEPLIGVGANWSW